MNELQTQTSTEIQFEQHIKDYATTLKTVTMTPAMTLSNNSAALTTITNTPTTPVAVSIMDNQKIIVTSQGKCRRANKTMHKISGR